jgi:CDP-diacylglycerol--glycerol-3-phosphate 3-phosphatidyltransferase
MIAEKVLTISNVLTFYRMVSAPILLYISFFGNKPIFIIIFITAILSDFLDGKVARKLGQTTEFGATIDSIGDLLLIIVLPICVWKLWPEIFDEEKAFILLILLGDLISMSAGLIKFGRMNSFHNWIGKLGFFLLGVSSVFLLVWRGSEIFFRVSAVIYAVSGIESAIITIVLSGRKTNVPGLWHALKMRK